MQCQKAPEGESKCDEEAQLYLLVGVGPGTDYLSLQILSFFKCKLGKIKIDTTGLNEN